MSSTKQVLVIRKDLKMRRGKEGSQLSHASMAFLTKSKVIYPFTKEGKFILESVITPAQKEWIESSYTKITCVVESEKELVDLYDHAISRGVEAHLITDNGLTEFHGVPTKTALAIGPDYNENIDPITKDLKLY
jgi:PTH2 family peptidyl-tRNA hydrolase